jgi:hypothetical protein
VADKAHFDRQVRRTAFMTVALLAALVFGIVVLVGGDWIPGGIIVAATLIGLAKQIPVIRMSQAGFDGDLDSRILSSGEESLRRYGSS